MHQPIDQPRDWTEPGAHPVAPGVHRVPLPLPFDGLHAVNAYVIDDGAGPVLIDSGWAMPDTEKALAAALREVGHELADVAQFVVTHAHWDHYTQALALRATFGTRVRIGRGERPSIEAAEGPDGAYSDQVRLLRRCGAAGLAGEIAGFAAENADVAVPFDVPFGPPDAWLDDGERIRLDRGRLEVHATPGHTRGHVVLRDAAAGLLFSGDHVLPHITPSIGLERRPEPAPLRSYLASLRLVRDLPDTLLLPAHGPVRPSVHTRVDELIAHHEARLADAAGAVRAGADTAFAVARSLPWTSRQRRFDDLGAKHRMLAVLEIDAHLDLLADHGQLDAHEAGGVRRYAPAD